METPKTMRFEIEKEINYIIEVDVVDLRKHFPEVWEEYVDEDSEYEDDEERWGEDVEEFVKEVLYSEGEDIYGVKQTRTEEVEHVYYTRIRW